MEANAIKMMDYFKIEYFSIPIFQRDYIWKAKNVESVLKELIESFEDDFKNNYFGSTFLKVEDNKWLIIDGQQRTTFFYIIVNWLFWKIIRKSREEGKTEKEIEEFCDDDKVFKFWYEKIKRIKFESKRENILRYNPKEEIFEKFNDKYDKEINRSLNLIKKKFKNYNVRKLLNFLRNISTKIIITRNDIGSEDNINDIYSSINSKGSELQIWDLIRNDIFRSNKSTIDYLSNIDNYVDNMKDWNNKNINNANAFLEPLLLSYLLKKSEKVFNNNKMYDEYSEIFKRDSLNVKDFNDYLERISKFDLNNFEKGYENDYELKWIYLICLKFQLKQIMSLFFFSLDQILISKDKKNKNRIIYFYKNLIIYYICNINIKSKRANNFESFIRRKSFFEKFIQYNFKNLFIDSEELKEINVEDLEKIFLKKDDEYLKISKNKNYLYLLYWLDVKEINDAKTFATIVRETFEHVEPESNKFAWVNNIGNLIFYDEIKNLKAGKTPYKEKLKKFYQSPTDGIKHWNGFQDEKDSRFIMYDYFHPKNNPNNNEWNEKIVLEKTESIFKSINDNIIRILDIK